MIVGAGKMSELAARHLRRSGASHVFVTNRTHERAVEMAAALPGHARRIHPLREHAAGGRYRHHHLRARRTTSCTKEDMQRVISARRNKPMFLIDIAVPRNIEPSVNDLDNIFLYDIDDLQEVVNANLRERLKEADHAETLVAEEVERMMARLKVAEVTPTIVSLQEQLEQIRAGEIEKVRRKYGRVHPGAGTGHRGHHPRHREQDRARPHLRTAQPRRTPRRRPRRGSHPKGVSPPGSIHAGNRIARLATCAVAGPLGGARSSPRWARLPHRDHQDHRR